MNPEPVNDIDMRLGPVTKITKETRKRLKTLAMTSFQ